MFEHSRKKTLLFIPVCLALILALNTTSLPVILGLDPPVQAYRYIDAEVTEILECPEKGKPVDIQCPGTQRTFTKHYLPVWQWGDDLPELRWSLPYHQD